MRFIHLIVVLLLQSVLNDLNCEALVERTNDDYLNPLLESLDIRTDSIQYEAEWIASIVEGSNITENLLDIFISLRSTISEPYQPYLLTSNQNDRRVPSLFIPNENFQPMPLTGLRNQRVGADSHQSIQQFRGSYQRLSDILRSLITVGTEDRVAIFQPTTLGRCTYDALVMLVAVNKVLYGANSCQLIVRRRSFSVTHRHEEVARFPKLRHYIMTRGSNYIKNCTDKSRIYYKSFTDHPSRGEIQHDESGRKNLDELLMYSRQQVLGSDLELFDAARDLSFKGSEGLKQLLPSIRRSRRFDEYPKELESVHEIVRKSCKSIRSGLEQTVGMFVLLLGIDTCSLDQLEDINPVFAKMNEYLRLCNELKLANRE